MAKIEITISVDTDYDLRGSKTELKEHVHDAVRSWGKQRHPDDWLWDFFDDVKVGPVREVKK